MTLNWLQGKYYWKGCLLQKKRFNVPQHEEWNVPDGRSWFRDVEYLVDKPNNKESMENNTRSNRQFILNHSIVGISSELFLIYSRSFLISTMKLIINWRHKSADRTEWADRCKRKEIVSHAMSMYLLCFFLNIVIETFV